MVLSVCCQVLAAIQHGRHSYFDIASRSNLAAET